MEYFPLRIFLNYFVQLAILLIVCDNHNNMLFIRFDLFGKTLRDLYRNLSICQKVLFIL